MNDKKQNNQNAIGIALSLVFFFFGLFALIPIFPPFGILWCVMMGFIIGSMVKNSKLSAKKNAREQRKPTGQEARVNDRRHGKAEERIHSHTPVVYSYDECAVEKRLEQLDTLKGAGLLDDTEYAVRRQKLLKKS